MSDKPDPFTFTGDDRATRLAAVALAWSVLHHFYPYFDVIDTDWPAVLRQALRDAADDPDAHAFLDTLRAMIAQLHDGQGDVHGPLGSSDVRSVLPIRWDWVGEQLVISQAAEKLSGTVTAGDIVLEIDGREVPARYTHVVRLISAATVQFKRRRALYELSAMDGSGTTELTLLKRDGRRVRVRIARVFSPSGGLGREKKPDTIAELRPGIVYVDLSRGTYRGFQKALGELAEADGIVFDLRGYPNRIRLKSFFPHLITQPVTSAEWMIPIFRLPNQDSVTYARSRWNLQPAEPYLGANKVFITDGRAVSAAESYLGIVEHHRLGEIVGGPTAGTNGNVNKLTLPGGYRVTWTGMKVLKQDGSQHHGVGILPTVPVSRTIAGIAAGRDELLERAIEVVARHGPTPVAVRSAKE